MKFTLLVVGRTVEKHYITAINDYAERTKHYISFDIEVIPELKNTKSLSMEQQKEKEGALILKALQPGDVPVLLDEHGKEFRSVEFASWVERKCIQSANGWYSLSADLMDFLLPYMQSPRKNFPFENDILTPDDSVDICGTALSCHDYPEQRSVSPRMKTSYHTSYKAGLK